MYQSWSGKIKERLTNPDFTFLGLQFSAILTFEKKFGKMHIAIRMLQIFKGAALVSV